MGGGRFGFFAILLMIFGACASPASAGGTYMARSADRAELLQIVASPDGSLSGSAIFIEVSNAGKLSTMQYALTGSKEGKALQLVLKSGVFGVGDVHLIGEETANGIRVSVASGTQGIASGFYVRGTMRQFEVATSELKKIAVRRAAVHAENEAIRADERRLENAAKQFANTEQEARRFLAARSRVPDYKTRTEARYASLETEMDRLVKSASRVNGDPIDQRYARVDLQYALGDVDYEARDVDYEVSQAVSDHVADAQEVEKMLAGFDGRCDVSSEAVRAEVAKSVKDRWKAACSRLAAIHPSVNGAIDDTGNVAKQFEALAAASRQRRATYLQP